tara:strand:+ start:75 stop:746 length:672 start_codon:yes stop_codon:yes gene_type:complete
MFEKNNLKIYNLDCMELMKNYSDNYFDLAIVDPPYGIGFGNFNRTNKASNGERYKSNKYKNSNWDDGIPNDEYFAELKRVSKNQIVWGGNYFPFLWKNGCRGFIFWYKGNPVENFADGELAWTSFDKVAKCFDYRYYGSLMGNSSADKKIHPTQKPIQLYNWILKNYATTDDKILDTHLGSGSTAIACFYYGCKEFVGMEIDKDYFNTSIKRIKQETAQIKLL